jgi:tryptophan-rich sensory protein
MRTGLALISGSSRILKPVSTAAGAALLVAILGGTMTDTGPWYQALEKPAWQPPDWAFAPAWTIIFALAAAAAAIAWRDAPDWRTRKWVAGLFALNGFLNVAWSLLFFQLRRPDWALAEVVLLWGSILQLVVYLGRFSPPAARLLLVYLAWVTFAAILNLAVVLLNRPFGGA